MDDLAACNFFGKTHTPTAVEAKRRTLAAKSNHSMKEINLLNLPLCADGKPPVYANNIRYALLSMKTASAS